MPRVFRRVRSILTPLILVLMASACSATNAGSPGRAPTRTPDKLALFRVVIRSTAPAPRYDIVIVDADGSRTRVVVGESRPNGVQPLLFDRPSWSADGQKIIFTADDKKSRGLVGSPTDLYTVRANGKGLRRLTRSGRAFAPVLAPTGRTIALAQRVPAARLPFTTSLWSMRASGGRARRLLPSSEGQRDLPGSWSPDGSVLAFTRSRYDPRTNTVASAIYVVRPDGSRLRRLTDRGSDPAWSPDGRHIAFVSDRDRNGQLSYGDRAFFANELYVMDADGGHPVRVTRTKQLNETSPSWSPDGRVIAYQRGRVIGNAEGMEVLAVNVSGSCTTRIAADPKLLRWYARPSWRPHRPTLKTSLRC